MALSFLVNYIKIALIRLTSVFYVKRRSKVIFYHDIHSANKYTEMSTSLDQFRRHIQIIRQNNYKIVSRISNPFGQVQICFDDGFFGLYDNIDVIKDLDVPIELFVVSSFLDRKNYISRSHLLDLDLLPQITISSHTHEHHILSSMSEDNIIFQLEESKRVLEDILNKEITSLCFPEGMFNNKIIDIARKSGYQRLYSSLPGFYFNKYRSVVVKRSLVQFLGDNTFRAVLKGGDHFLFFWYKIKHLRR